jgi:single-stranded DNA-binding protein
MNNQVILVGVINSKFECVQEIFNENFYTVTMAIKRDSGKVDLLPLLISEKLLDMNKNYIGVSVAVNGDVISYNQHDNGKNRLKIYIFVNKIEQIKTDCNINDVFLEGYICKKPIHRYTPLGREITDIMLAVKRTKNKSDFIPCVIWGENAFRASFLNAGDRIRVSGRMQSRLYTKDNEQKTTYELSVNLMEIF